MNSRRPHWWLANIGSSNGFSAIRQQTTAWTRVGHDLLCYMAWLGQSVNICIIRSHYVDILWITKQLILLAHGSFSLQLFVIGHKQEISLTHHGLVMTYVFIEFDPGGGGGGGGGGGTQSGFIQGCAAPGSEPLPYFRESRTPKTYPILGKFDKITPYFREIWQNHTLL